MLSISRILLQVLVSCLFVENIFAGYVQGLETNSWQNAIDSYGAGSSSNYGANFDNRIHGSYGHQINTYQPEHQELSLHGGFENHGHFGHGGGWDQHQYAHAVPISEHVEVSRPIPVPVYKNIGVPVAQPLAIRIPHPIAIGVPQPYPVHVPVAKPVAIPVVKTIAVPVEKKVPYPVEKIIPVPVEKPVPITIEKHIPVPVEKPYPIHIPVYKHIFHRGPPSHGHGWGR